MLQSADLSHPLYFSRSRRSETPPTTSRSDSRIFQAARKALSGAPTPSPKSLSNKIFLDRSRAPSSLLAKTAWVGIHCARAILVVLSFGLAAPYLYQRKTSLDCARHELRKEMALASLEALRKHDKKDRLGALILNKTRYKQWAKELKIIANICNQIPSKDAHPYQILLSFHTAFRTIAISKEFANLCTDHPQDSLVALMQDLAISIAEHTNGISVYEAFGGAVLGDFKIPQTTGDLAGLFKKAIKNPEILKPLERDSWSGAIQWALFNPNIVYQNIRGHQVGAYFESVAAGNMPSRGWTYPGKHEVQTLLGPGTFDPIREMHLYACANEKTQRIAIHNLQTSRVAGEAERLDHIKELNEISDEVSFSSTVMDGNIWKGKSPQLKGLSTPTQYMKALKDALPNESSYFIPDASLTEPLQKYAYGITAFAFEQAIDEGNTLWNNWDEKRRGKAFQLAIQGFISFGELLQLQNSGGGSKMDVCKQLVDRGAVLTITTRILYLLEQKKLLGNEASSDQDIAELAQEIKQLTGLLTGRAVLVDNRTIFKDRYAPLLDFLTFFSGHEHLLVEALKSYRSVIEG